MEHYDKKRFEEVWKLKLLKSDPEVGSGFKICLAPDNQLKTRSGNADFKLDAFGMLRFKPGFKSLLVPLPYLLPVLINLPSSVTSMGGRGVEGVWILCKY